MPWVKIFGYLLASGVAITSLWMFAMGGRWQAIEASAYSGARRPWWFWVISLLLIGLYIASVTDFLSTDKTWATWALVVIIPVGWIIKGGMIVFNPKGRQAVSSIAGDAAWRKTALARLPVALIVGVLAYFA